MTPTLDPELKKKLEKVANTIRHLSIDAVQKANSGHPGLPLGCAELGAYLYGYALRHNPKDPHFVNRDRMILSAGHGSMWLYSCLHLAGFNLSLEDITHFRQLHSITPGHPEYGMTPGVEATTGPLGQGVGNAVGQALGLKMLAARFNSSDTQLFNAKVYCLAGDGCIMEGVSSEVSSFAGHLQLNNLILFYDANKICLDGELSECCSEDTAARYKAYGWDVHNIDGYDLDALHSIVYDLQSSQKRPVLIMLNTIIGKGSPNKAGTNKAHGSPLGPEEVSLTKKALGLPEEDFHVPQGVKSFFERKLVQDKQREDDWNKLFENWAKNNPEKAKEFEAMSHKSLPGNLEEILWSIEMKPSQAGRTSSQQVINKLVEVLPQLVGGSADLSCSDLTLIKGSPLISKESFKGRNIKYGVREFGMGTIANGLALTEMFTPFVGTFLTFSDYMRNSIRLAALSKIQVIYQFTHDSIFLGEDGPTHQPVEHAMALRAIPHLHVIRPADNNEVKMAWMAALNYAGPTAILLSRQNLPELKETKVAYNQGMGCGAYLLKRERAAADYTLFATGSEVSLAMNVADELERRGKNVRVVSMPCWQLFEKQPKQYRQSIVGGNLGKRVSIEAGTELGWHKYIGIDGIAIAMEDFGASAPQSSLSEEYGFEVDAILERILN